MSEDLVTRIAELEAERDDAQAHAADLEGQVAELENRLDRFLTVAEKVGRSFVRWGNDVEMLTGAMMTLYAVMSDKVATRCRSTIPHATQQEILEEVNTISHEVQFARPLGNPGFRDYWEMMLDGRTQVEQERPWPSPVPAGWTDIGSGTRAIRRVQAIVGQDGDFEHQVDKLINLVPNEDLKERLATAIGVCESLADWWRRDGISGTPETDEIASRARKVVAGTQQK